LDMKPKRQRRGDGDLSADGAGGGAGGGSSSAVNDGSSSAVNDGSSSAANDGSRYAIDSSSGITGRSIATATGGGITATGEPFGLSGLLGHESQGRQSRGHSTAEDSASVSCASVSMELEADAAVRGRGGFGGGTGSAGEGAGGANDLDPPSLDRLCATLLDAHTSVIALLEAALPARIASTSSETASANAQSQTIRARLESQLRMARHALDSVEELRSELDHGATSSATLVDGDGRRTAAALAREGEVGPARRGHSDEGGEAPLPCGSQQAVPPPLEDLVQAESEEASGTDQLSGRSPRRGSHTWSNLTYCNDIGEEDSWTAAVWQPQEHYSEAMRRYRPSKSMSDASLTSKTVRRRSLSAMLRRLFTSSS